MNDSDYESQGTFLITQPVSVLLIPVPNDPTQFGVVEGKAQRLDGTWYKCVPVYTEPLHAERALAAAPSPGCKVHTFTTPQEFVEFLRKVEKAGYAWISFDPQETSRVTIGIATVIKHFGK
jgi:hypothetical protein